MYLYIVVLVYWPLSVLCVFVCVMSNQSTSKKPHYLSNLSKLNNLYKTHIKFLLVLKYQGLTWRDHPFNQRNRTTERTVGVGVRGGREVGGGGGQGARLDKIWKKEVGVGNISSLHKTGGWVGGLAALCQLSKETLKISHPPHFWLPPHV